MGRASRSFRIHLPFLIQGTQGLLSGKSSLTVMRLVAKSSRITESIRERCSNPGWRPHGDSSLHASLGAIPVFGEGWRLFNAEGTVILAHLTDLRTALDQTYMAAAGIHAPCIDSSITAGTPTIKRVR
jgi:hypothetical protein